MDVKGIDFTATGILSKLISDYLHNKAEIQQLIAAPYQLSAIPNIIATHTDDCVDRDLLVEEIYRQYESYDLNETTKANIKLLNDCKTYTVTTAHQPVLFTGPLYLVIKIACAIKMAKQLNEEYPEYKFVPVYWMGSEDHDFEEINHANVFGKKLEWEAQASGAVGRLSTESIQPVLDQLAELIKPEEFPYSLFSEAYKDQSTFGAATFQIVNELFKDKGLIVVDQDSKGFKQRIKEVIKDELLHGRSASLIKENLAYLDQHYHVQAHSRDINLFYIEGNRRDRIVKEGEQYLVNNTDTSFTEEEILALAENEPEKFSPNVILRPLYQEIILPNVAYVGGGGETAYWMQLKPIFDHYQKPYPILALRTSLMLLNKDLQKKIDKFELSIEDLFGEKDEVVRQYVESTLSDENDLSAELEDTERIFDQMIEKATKVDKSLEKSVLAEKQKLINSLKNIENKIVRAQKRNNETSVNQLQNVFDKLRPNGGLQERHDNIIPWLVKYQRQAIDMIIEAVDPFSKEFKVVFEE